MSVGKFNTPLSIIKKAGRQKQSTRYRRSKKNTMKYFGIDNLYRKLHTIMTGYTYFTNSYNKLHIFQLCILVSFNLCISHSMIITIKTMSIVITPKFPLLHFGNFILSLRKQLTQFVRKQLIYFLSIMISLHFRDILCN